MEILTIIKLILIITYIVDYSDIMISIKKLIWKLINGKKIPFQFFTMKPFDCSKCLSFWVILIYMLLNSNGIIESLFVSILSSYISIYVSILWDIIYINYKKLTDKLC